MTIMIYDYIGTPYVRVKTKEKLYFNGYLDVNLDMGRGGGRINLESYLMGVSLSSLIVIGRGGAAMIKMMNRIDAEHTDN